MYHEALFTTDHAVKNGDHDHALARLVLAYWRIATFTRRLEIDAVKLPDAEMRIAYPDGQVFDADLELDCGTEGPAKWLDKLTGYFASERYLLVVVAMEDIDAARARLESLKGWSEPCYAIAQFALLDDVVADPFGNIWELPAKDGSGRWNWLKTRIEKPGLNRDPAA